MITSASCNNNKPISRCHVPLIEICGSTSQIKLDLGACGLCSTIPLALLIRKGGCTEWETVSEPSGMSCCGVIDNRRSSWGNTKLVEKPKPSIIYPLHEINNQGLSVFVLDDKLKGLGYGRYHAVVLVDADTPQGEQPNYKTTNIIFDIDYIEYAMGLVSIDTEQFQPNLGDC